METTEKIVSLYLRLNGFFLMPHFTTFVGEFKHVDLLGVRFKNAAEKIGGYTLKVDEDFLARLNGNSKDIKLWVEVGSAREIPRLFPEKKEDYVKRIFGSNNGIKKACFDFSLEDSKLCRVEKALVISKGRCRDFILSRFAQMESEPLKSRMKELTKEGSWSWSEEFLGDLLFLRKTGFLRKK